jgi:mono/diheme cytochrome c family protein
MSWDPYSSFTFTELRSGCGPFVASICSALLACVQRSLRRTIMPLTRRLAPPAILVLTAVTAHAQDGDVAAGHDFAREACNACHVVEAEQRKPRRIVIGPAFREIANTRGMTATVLRVFLTTSHPKMPNLILTPEEIADVTSYILSLRGRPPS